MRFLVESLHKEEKVPVSVIFFKDEETEAQKGEVAGPGLSG